MEGFSVLWQTKNYTFILRHWIITSEITKVPWGSSDNKHWGTVLQLEVIKRSLEKLLQERDVPFLFWLNTVLWFQVLWSQCSDSREALYTSSGTGACMALALQFEFPSQSQKENSKQICRYKRLMWWPSQSLCSPVENNLF